MKIRLLSDLHLEGCRGYDKITRNWAEYKGEDVMVLAGDIAVGPSEVARCIKYLFAQGFPEIIYTPGNHELYHHDRGMHVNVIKAAQDVGALTLDAKEVHIIKDVTFFGGTLWTDFWNDDTARITAKSYINDFKVITGWTPDQAIQENIRQVDFIKKMYELIEGKKVIVTHFLPAYECVSERFKEKGVTFLLNKYFANNLGSWIGELKDTTWLFGHTHDSMDFMLGDTRLVSNPLGYSGEYVPEYAAFNPHKVIEV